MVQSQLNYSPAQILEAARRAESDGRREYALQFFRHLVDHYPASPEAGQAREGLNRLGAMHTHEPSDPLPGMFQKHADPVTGPPTQPTAGPGHHPHPHAQGSPATSVGQPYINGAQASHGQTNPAYLPQPTPSQQPPGNAPTGAPTSPPRATVGGSQGHAHPAPSVQQNRLNLEPVAGAEPAERRAAAPEPRLRRHTIGRICAFLLVALGACAMASGFGLIAGVFIAPKIVGAIAGGGSLISGAITAVSVVIVGLVLVLNGLMAGAVFANSRMLYDIALMQYQNQSRRSR